MQLRYEKMLRNAESEMSFLQKETELSHEATENGSIIETEQNFYFVGISVPLIKLKEKQIISFSEDAPIFQSMKGKKVGDEVKIGDNKEVISSIF